MMYRMFGRSPAAPATLAAVAVCRNPRLSIAIPVFYHVPIPR